ncbi:alpha-amylase family glycosyl hydrolase [Streptococcus dysgalactiae]|uniref:alpha-amylase family glycosyl hydrolase n=1 Tax=Streptococcus dysgalactiae TaxID=1334 RepID=UPI001CF2682E|nr:alpha-amylase family glycosyl hydrolase [Streptococcus dysgalactiae]MCB2840627.1 KxYKxGKxW signal peptide domain-containing protein [Streptococcus dysgalactiae subsp. dysgalactiae]MCB2844448.1 KxYKxGKxW signal peptide domain-containing protein [Streptococcus dysgalactiae subsp. dysgalactiae]
MMRKASPETKVTNYRMWKSGKQWLFGASLVAASLLVMNTQAFADDGNPVVSESTSMLVAPVSSENSTTPEGSKDVTAATNEAIVAPSSHNPVGPQVNADTSKDEETKANLYTANNTWNDYNKDTEFQTPQPVTIHYTGDSNASYTAWVWGDNEANKSEGRWEQFTKEQEGNKFSLKIQADKSVTSFKYIVAKNVDITKKNVFGNQDKKTGDMTAPVSVYTPTDIYHNENDGWYSQFANVQTKEFDQRYGYTDKQVDEKGQVTIVGQNGQLGASFDDKGNATFNVWAPTANAVSVNIYQSTDENAPLLKTVELKRGKNYDRNDHTKNTIGLWSVTIKSEELGQGAFANIAYDYKLTIPRAFFIQKTEEWKESDQEKGKWYKVGDQYVNSAGASKEKSDKLSSNASKEDISKFYVGSDQTVTIQDPYSIATVRNGKRSVLVAKSAIGGEVQQTNNVRVSSKTQMSVMEMDVRDFTIDPHSGISDQNKGNFLGVVEEGTKDTRTGQKTGLDYLKYLGVKYVQMMPLYDFQTVPELDQNDPKNNSISTEFSADDQQNWGYDPKNYNVPEGSYSTNPADPVNRIKELKEMVQKLHDAGINVVMDVVYNHLYDGQNNPFEYTVPGYYYAINHDGKMNNDVGVGNAIRSNSEMMRQYIVNSVVHWIKEYGMDGFRFDAMSDLDVTTLNAIREAINKIDGKIVTYGEGWDSMGKYLYKDGDKPTSVSHAKETPEVGHFDSIGRDAIAGSHYDNGNPPGFVNETSEYKDVKVSVLADSLLGGHHRSFQDASQQLNYIEVHDGMTLSDLLKHYNQTDKDNVIIHQNRAELATAMSGLSQGIHFFQHGQEFLREKAGAHNTYNAGDEKNKIDWELTSKNVDVVNFMKSLLTLRTNESLWHLKDYEAEIFKKMKITNAQKESGIITFELQEDNGDKYLVVFNNNTSSGDKSLTLGDTNSTNWYYGRQDNFTEFKNTDGNRGKINETNDFTNAYIVTTNSKNLYNKIGQMNGQKTITMDHLSATVLYIPKAVEVAKLTTKADVTYIDQEGKKLVIPANQGVSYLKVEFNDPNSKFGYEVSGIATTSDQELGHTKNVLTKTSDGIQTVTKYYMAVDKATGHVVSVAQPTSFINGTPQSTDANIEWKEVTEAAPAELNVSQDSGEATGESPKGSSVGNNIEQGESVTQETTVTTPIYDTFLKSMIFKKAEKAVKRENKHQQKQLKLERKTAKK